MKRLFNIILMISLIAILNGCGSKEVSGNIEEEKANYTYEYIDNYVIKIKNLPEYINVYEEVREDKLVDYVKSNLVKEESLEKLDFNTVREDINNAKYDIAKVCEESRKKPYTYYYGTEEERKGKYPFLTNDEYRHLKDKKKVKYELTKQEVIDEIILIDRFYRTIYGPLKIQGIEKFNKAHEDLLEKYHNINNSEKVLFTDYEKDIKDAYGFIRDLHSRIGYETPRDSTKLSLDGYYYDRFYFLKDDKGYYIKDYSPKVYLDSVKGDTNLDDYLHYSIEPSGELAYMICFNDLAYLEDKSCDISLDGKNFRIPLKQMDGSNAYKNYELWENEVESFTLEEGYPTLSIRVFNTKWTETNRFIENGKILHDEDVVILDTRTNGGGTGGPYTKPFFEYLVSYEASGEYETADLNYDTGSGKVKALQGGIYNTVLIHPGRVDVVEGYDNLLITLTDAESGSHGDMIAKKALSIKNALLIGEPTMCCIIGAYTLPYYFDSGLNIDAGFGIEFPMGEDYMPDGIGFPPEIWVDSDEALDKTLAMLKYYDIKPGPKASDILKERSFGTNCLARTDLKELQERYDNDFYPKVIDQYHLKINADPMNSNILLVREYFNPKTNALIKLENCNDRIPLKEGKYILEGFEVEIIKK